MLPSDEENEVYRNDAAANADDDDAHQWPMMSELTALVERSDVPD